ncbi:Putative glutamine amidotransferase-like protein C13C5,04 [Schizosaccharomyces pombe 972h-] [Rhizoctonia solani]|uniref:Putative glutamine amidotransferase-like protein C13C5,04 [Schizosaccharomyces pombe 972h-] n=1 Tax=Rhizoctonia solani TaxID=456999 RepID=A0A0K6G2F4_9AGAM|nr:Putative glutamine amidotransferase-like protein C13C5,04 [Schizosaccharomyces pombe 972h-] [Rhizoctonia solani]
MPVPAVQATHGTYLDIFRAYLQKSLELVLESKGQATDNVQFTLDRYEVFKHVYPDDTKLATYDGIALTGAAVPAYGPSPWIPPLLEFVARVIKDYPKIKIFGICFGHQIVARALGGRCVVNEKGWEVGVHDVRLSSIGKELFNVNELRIQELHRAHVPITHLPPGFEIAGSTPTCANQGMILRYPDAGDKDKVGFENVHVLTLQGHPELNESIVSNIIDAKESNGRLDPSSAAEGRRRVSLQHDSVSVVGRVMWGILGVSRVDKSMDPLNNPTRVRVVETDLRTNVVAVG